MTWLSDSALGRLRAAMDTPDLNGTRYRFVEKLGHGGMGEVYSVEDTVLGRRVALKAIAVVEGGDELARRLLQEARVIAQLEHPGIVPVHDAGTLPDGRVFYTMKLVVGSRLDQYFAAPGNLPDRLRIFERICDAVSFAHARGVLHRDLKPQNIMVGPFGEVLVMDWGLSKILGLTTSFSEDHESSASPHPETAHGSIVGTPGYMAPEQKCGEEVDPRADVYSLGAILQFLLSTATPSRMVAAIAAKAMAEDPAQRYSSVKELAEDVAHYLDGLPVTAYPESWLSRAWRWMVRNRAWILLILAYLVMRALFILWRRR